MKVTLNRQDLNNEQLSWLCVKTFLEGVRGKESSVKAEVYNQLNEGQKALYIFYAFHNHTESAVEFYWFASYFISELKGWPALIEGLMFYKEEQLMSICSEISQLVEAHNKQSDGSWRQALASDLDQDSVLLASVTDLYERYIPLAKQGIQSMNRYIRDNNESFLILID